MLLAWQYCALPATTELLLSFLLELVEFLLVHKVATKLLCTLLELVGGCRFVATKFLQSFVTQLCYGWLYLCRLVEGQLLLRRSELKLP